MGKTLMDSPVSGDTFEINNSVSTLGSSGGTSTDSTLEDRVYRLELLADDINNSKLNLISGEGLYEQQGSATVLRRIGQITPVARSVITWTNNRTIKTLDPIDSDDAASKGYVDNQIIESNKYTDNKIAALLGTVPETLDTFEEIKAAFDEDQSVLDTLNAAIGLKANQSSLDSTNASLNTIKTKVDGIEAGAQKNTVASVNGKTGEVILAASDISGISAIGKTGLLKDATADSTHRLVTDAQISAWDGKADALLLNNYLPLTAGGDKPLTGDLVLTTDMLRGIYFKNSTESGSCGIEGYANNVIHITATEEIGLRNDYTGNYVSIKNNTLYQNGKQVANKEDIPTDNNQLSNGAGYITSSALTPYLLKSGGVMTGSITLTNNLGVNTQSGNAILVSDGTNVNVGHGNHATLIRGSSISFTNRPKYNSNNLALVSEIPTNYVTTNTNQTNITGAKTFNADVNIGTSSTKRNLYIYGDIYQNGSTYITHAEQLYTKSDFVYTRDGATAALGSSSYTGIIAKLYDGTNDGGILYDNKGVGRIGDITYSNGTPVVTAMQPIATREETPNNYGVMYWNNASLKLSSIAPATAGKVLTANGTSSAPSWKAPLKKRGVFTLTTSGWSSKKQTITVSGLSTADFNTIVPELGTNGVNSINWAKWGINAIAEATNSITFSCSIIPTSNLTFYVVSEVME